MDMLCFIFCGQDYLNWLTSDILQLFSVMQILTAGAGKRHYFQSIHTCLFQSGGVEGTCYEAVARHTTIWKMTFYQDYLQLWAWVTADSVQVNCSLCPYVLEGVCTAIQIALSLSLSPHHFLYLSIVLYVVLSWTCSQTHTGKCRVTKEDDYYEEVCSNTPKVTKCTKHFYAVFILSLGATKIRHFMILEAILNNAECLWGKWW